MPPEETPLQLNSPSTTTLVVCQLRSGARIAFDEHPVANNGMSSVPPESVKMHSYHGVAFRVKILAASNRRRFIEFLFYYILRLFDAYECVG